MPTLLNNRLIYSDLFRKALNGDKIFYADAGAREGLQGPWSVLDQKGLLNVIGFEPDEQEYKSLNKMAGSTRKYFPYALWSGPGELSFCLAEAPSTSSVFPPNLEYLKNFKEEHWMSRATRKVIPVRCDSLDNLLKARRMGCDFFKIDTHGAEYEILKGAEDTLKSDVFGVLVETWTDEVHKGQKMTGDILVWMQERGFSLFDIGIAAAWPRQSAKKYNILGKAKITGLDLLFFKMPFMVLDMGYKKSLKAAAIAELYGYPDYAVDILDAMMTSFLNEKDFLELCRDCVVANFGRRKNMTRIANAVVSRIARIFGYKPEGYPSLH